MLVEIADCADLVALNECLDLIGASASLVVNETVVKPDWLKLPKSGSQRQRVLLWFVEQGNASRDELKAALNIDDGSADPRVHELVHGGWLSETGESRTTRGGRQSAVLAPTDKCRTQLRLIPTPWFPANKRIEVA